MKYSKRRKKRFRCKVCGDIFYATRPDARYCKKPRCRQRMSRALRKLKAEGEAAVRPAAAAPPRRRSAPVPDDLVRFYTKLANNTRRH